MLTLALYPLRLPRVSLSSLTKAVLKTILRVPERAPQGGNKQGKAKQSNKF